MPGGKADHQKTPFPGDRAQRGLGIIAADGIVDHVGALLAAGGLEDLGELLLPVAVERAGGIDDALVGAPALRRLDLFGDDAAAITRAPIALPSSTAAEPTPPAAPSTSSVSPGFSAARSFSA